MKNKTTNNNKKQGLFLGLGALLFCFGMFIPFEKVLALDVSNTSLSSYNGYGGTSPATSDSILITPDDEYLILYLKVHNTGIVGTRNPQVTFDGDYMTKDTCTAYACAFSIVAPDVETNTYFDIKTYFTAGSQIIYHDRELYIFEEITGLSATGTIAESPLGQISDTINIGDPDDKYLFVAGTFATGGGSISSLSGLTSNYTDGYHYSLYNDNVSANQYIETNLTNNSFDQIYYVLDVGSLAVVDITESLDQYTIQGAYVVPDQINCYNHLDYCDMVFGYGLDAYSRSLTELDPDDQVYPNFSWYWPDENASSTYGATLRRHIDLGQSRYVQFDFPTPTSTTDYVLEIQDPAEPEIGSSSLFTVRLNLIATSSGIFSTCMGTCEDGIFGEIFCGVKKAVCFFVIPTDNATNYIKASFDILKYAPPFSLVTEISDALTSSTQSQIDDRSAVFEIPFINATGTFYMLPVLTASSMANTIGEENTSLFRTSIVWLMYIFAILGIFNFLIHRSK